VSSAAGTLFYKHCQLLHLQLPPDCSQALPLQHPPHCRQQLLLLQAVLQAALPASLKQQQPLL
jgi:hypothetical protein